MCRLSKFAHTGSHTGIVSGQHRELDLALENVELRISRILASAASMRLSASSRRFATRCSGTIPVCCHPTAEFVNFALSGRVLGGDVERARALLRDLLETMVLAPTPEGVVAELRGNVEIVDGGFFHFSRS